MRFYQKLLATITLLLGLVIATPALAGAQSFNPFENTCDNSPQTNSSAVCTERANNPTGNNPVTGTHGIIRKVIAIVSVVGGIIAVIMIMVSGLQMILSSGDTKKFAEFRTALIYAAVGIAVILLANVIISFILNHI